LIDVPIPKSKELVAKVREFFLKGETTLAFGDFSVSLLCRQFGIWPANGFLVVESVPIVLTYKGFKLHIPSVPVQIELPFEVRDPITQELMSFKIVIPYSACNPQFIKEGDNVRIAWSKGGRPSGYFHGIGFDIGSILLTPDYGYIDAVRVPGFIEPRLVFGD
jgi:hypothetical protein